ncbi:MAG: FAD-binding protein, partial [Gammaproteobacteria bacterium]|nr:FAD-binding protein [Gammaproteobacteria bacterium]
MQVVKVISHFISPQYATDVLIIGSGAAGLSLALQLAQEARVSVLSKAGME